MAHCSLDNVSNAMPRGSTALASYLSGVYGASAAASGLADRWQWSEVEVIRKRFLPKELLAACSWPIQPSGRGSLYTWWAPSQLIWVYQFDKGCDGLLPNYPWRGGTAIEVPGRWIEVIHEYVDMSISIEADVLYLTIAKGSGLWYYTGRTLVSNGNSIVDWLRENAPNATPPPKPVSPIGWPYTEFRKMGFATVVEDAHVDYQDGSKEGRCDSSKASGMVGSQAIGKIGVGFFKRELISLRLPHVQASCPPDPMHMAWGYPPNLHRPCMCVQNGDVKMRRAKPAPGAWAFHWPFELIECDTSTESDTADSGAGGGARVHHATEADHEHSALHRVVAYPKLEHSAWHPSSLSSAAHHGGAPPPRNVEEWMHGHSR